MKLLELRLRNFKGIKKMDLKANGGNLRIFGDNATGKTTIFDAFTWLLFDTDSKNKAEFGIKTWDPNGNVIHHLDHEVEGKFDVDGEIIELKKVYREKWVKRRGATERTFDGHETDYFVDGVPTTMTDYNNRIEEIAPEERFKLLTSPMHFNRALHWEERRNILLDICGDVSDSNVIESNKKLADLPKVLGKNTTDDHKKIIAASRAKINKELERIPVRVDEVKKGLPDVKGMDAKKVEDELAKLKKQKTAKEKEITALTDEGKSGELLNQVAELRAKMTDIESDYRKKHTEEMVRLEASIRTFRGNVGDVNREIDLKVANVKRGEESVEGIKKHIEGLRKEWHAVNEEAFDVVVDDVCPTCGQSLPAEQVEEAQERALGEFNLKKAERLSEINEAGKKSKAEMEKILAEIDGTQKTIEEMKAGIEATQKDIAKLEADLAEAEAKKDGYKDLPEYKKIAEEKVELEKILDGEQVDVAPQTARIGIEMKKIDELINEALTTKASLEAHKKGQERIEELEAEQKKLAAEYERLESELYLIEEFTRTKVDMLTDKINEKFKLARFKLFEIQINGALKEVCETTMGGVPWNDLNSGGQMNVGLDIINTLSDYYDFAPPIFVDNAESVTKLTPTKAQMVALVVSEKDKELRIGSSEEGKQKLFEGVK